MRVEVGTTVLLCAGLLVGSAIGVAAQNEEADPMAPAAVKGTEEIVTGSRQGRSRPRLGHRHRGCPVHQPLGGEYRGYSGEMTYIGQWQRYGSTDWVQVEASSRVLVNDGGRWPGTSS